MSIPALVQAYDEVRRLAIAGSMVAPGDFRLKKLVPPLEQAGTRAPVFAKVAEAVSRLVESKEQTSSAALLDLATLINSILYTQGETGLEGEISPLPTTEVGRPHSQASARTLKPLQEALTSRGEGRYEIIRDGINRGAFQDFRLLTPALAAIDDSYGELADLVADRVLPLYGAAILPDLEAGFDPKGRGGHVRRLLLMHQIDPGAARPHVLRSLEEGSQELRVAAIGCLGDSPDDLSFLLEQAKARAKDVRTAALKALGRSGADEAARTLCDAIRSDALALAVEPVRQSRRPAVTDFLLDEAELEFKALLEGKEKDAKKLDKRNERMILLLRCLEGREDARSERILLAMFGDLDRLAGVNGTPSGKDVIERLMPVMAAGPPRVQAALIDAHATLPPEGIGPALKAARQTRTPAEVFAMFSPYLTARVNEKKRQLDPAWRKRETVVAEFILPLRSRRPEGFQAPDPATIDPRWLDLAVEIGRDDLVYAIATPGHAGAREFLTKRFREKFGKAAKQFELAEVLDAMIRCKHPEATDSMIELIKVLARGKSTYGYVGIPYWIGHLIPQLPRVEALPKLEALLPTLPENMIDELLGHVTEMRQAEPDPATT
ncbi:HEAT repeat domain-containing protein [Aquisphaera insulae]|uniref:HEAT repeat domain-containing protein n=1 Tax=Aquisphaera insulae TaxID=2712864 RepID=UPI0013ED4DDA|nr:HEAT repeat domain-containing protein [Aquisphaera insulae]